MVRDSDSTVPKRNLELVKSLFGEHFNGSEGCNTRALKRVIWIMSEFGLASSSVPGVIKIF
jgi:hypothetical protein